MAVKFLGEFGSGTTEGAIGAILYSVDNGATVLNNSWGGGPYSAALLSAIEYANDNNVLFVAAAGNSGWNNDITDSYPANYEVDNVISVAATDHNDELASFSQYGLETVDLGAPGVNILSTVLGGQYDQFSGTSMATPHVAGAAALLMTYNRTLSIDDVKQILMDSADSISSLEGLTVSGGRLNLLEALSQTRPNWLEIIGPISGAIASDESITFNFNFTSSGLAPGAYPIELVLLSNDPDNNEIIIPVTLTVAADIIPPAAIVDLSSTSTTEDSTEIEFTATGDDGNLGRATQYDIRYHASPLNELNWDAANSISIQSKPKLSGEDETLTLSNLPTDSNLWIGVKVVDIGGLSSSISNIINVQTLNADLEVSPRVIGNFTLTPDEFTSRTVTLTNNGTVDLDVVLSTYNAENNNAAGTSANTMRYYMSRPFEKGQQDTRVGSPVISGAGGPDNFGYTWADSNEDSGPSYNWIDITTTGELITGFSDDSITGPIDIGFDFPFYGEIQNQIYLTSNGVMSFNEISDDGCCVGQPVPRDDTLNNIIAWLWYDLHPQSGQVYKQNIDANTLVIQFENYGEFSGEGMFDAQIILQKDGQITLQYKEFRNNLRKDQASIGIENADGSDGLQISFVTEYLEDQLAINITPSWLTTSIQNVSLLPEQSSTFEIQVTAPQAPGIYNGEIVIKSNDTEEPEIRLPISLEVTE
jgi:hypothetical protein